MTLGAYIRSYEKQNNRRWFAAFLLLQLVVIALVLFDQLEALAYGAVVLCAAAFIFLAIVHPWLLVPLIILTTALDATGRLVKTTPLGVPLTGFHVAFVLMVLILIMNILLRRQTTFPDFELKGPMFVFLGAMAVSLVYSPNQPEATISFMRMFFLIVFLYLSQVLVHTRVAIQSVVYSLVIAMIASSAMGAWQIASGEFHLPATVVSSLGANVPRASATYHNPNTFGGFLLAGVVPLFSVLIGSRMIWWRRLLIGVSCAFGVVGVLVTFSRSSWVSMAVGIFTVLLLARKLRFFFLGTFVVILLVVVLSLFVPFAAYLFDRFLSIFTLIDEFGSVGRTSSTTRVYLIYAAWEMFLDHPVLGVGLRAFPVKLSEYAPIGYPWWSQVKESHTAMATILAELGTVGILGALWFVFRTLRSGISGIRRTVDPNLRSILIGLVSAFVAFQVHQSFNGGLTDNIFWFFTGLIFSASQIASRESTDL